MRPIFVTLVPITLFCLGSLGANPVLNHQEPLQLLQVSAKPEVCPVDPSSFSNCMEVATFHQQLDVYVDFNASSIQGYNTMNMTVLVDGTSQVVIDY